MKPNVRPIPIDAPAIGATAAELTRKTLSLMKKRPGGIRMGQVIARADLANVHGISIPVEVVASKVDGGYSMGGVYWPGREAISIWLDNRIWVDAAKAVREFGPDVRIFRRKSRAGDRAVSIGYMIETILVHEATHALDPWVRIRSFRGLPATDALNMADYAADSAELAAHTQQIVWESLRLAKSMPRTEFESDRLYVEHLIERSPPMAKLEPYLDRAALNKIYKTVYQALVDKGYL